MAISAGLAAQACASVMPLTRVHEKLSVFLNLRSGGWSWDNSALLDPLPKFNCMNYRGLRALNKQVIFRLYVVEAEMSRSK